MNLSMPLYYSGNEQQNINSILNAMNNWNTCKLSDISADISYGYTESATSKDTGCKFLRITDIQNDHIDWETVPFCQINESDFAKYKLEVGDIVIARTGNSTGAISTIKNNVTAVFASYLIRFRLNRNLANPFFIDYIIRSANWRSFIESIKGGSAQPGANAKILASFEFVLPPLPIQHRIAEILGALDDKIELNRQMNKTLEELAQTLFKHHFVDGIDPENLPEGWRNGSIMEIADLLNGGTPKTDIQGYWNGSIKWLSAKDITANDGGFIIDTEKKVTELGILNSAAKLLPKHTTVVTARGTVGKYCILSEEMAISQSNYGLKFRHFDYDCFIYLIVENMIEKMVQFSYGTVFDTITTKTFHQIPIIIPPNQVIGDFEKVIKPIFDQRHNLKLENQSLSIIRDTLLPKLISGEIIPADLQQIEQLL